MAIARVGKISPGNVGSRPRNRSNPALVKKSDQPVDSTHQVFYSVKESGHVVKRTVGYNHDVIGVEYYFGKAAWPDPAWMGAPA